MKASGFTLAEVMVALAIAAIVGSISASAWMGLRPAEPKEVDELARARRAALTTGASVRIELASDSAPTAVLLALPDGRVLGKGIDPIAIPDSP